MENEHVAEAMQLCFGCILDGHDDIDWLLLLLLASIVHHSEFLRGIKDSVPNHPFANIPILRRPELLSELKKLITMKASERIPNATGIPPHVKELALLKETLDTCGEMLITLKEMIPELKVCLKDSIQEAAEQFAQGNGHVTASRLEEMFDSFEKKIFKELQSVTRHGTANNQHSNHHSPPPPPAFGFQNLLYGTYEYDNKGYWQVPQDFTFPASTQRRTGWDLWLKGDPGHRSKIRGQWKNTPVRPYRLMDPKHLPSKVRTVFKRSWRPIFLLMEEAPAVSIPRDPSSLDAPKINQLYNFGTQHLKSKVSYIWPDNENEEQSSRRDKWSVSTWSTKIGRSQVVKRGTQADQSNLAAATRFNEPHSHRPRKKRRVTRQGFQNRHDEEEVDQTLREMIRGLGADAQASVEREIREASRERELNQSRIIETANENGDRLIVDEGAARGYGASSRDPNYIQQLERIVNGVFEKGVCGIQGCTFPDLELRHKCHTCGKYVHIPCAMEKDLFEEGNDRAYCRLACKVAIN
jgi:hypothetical protein